MEGIRWFPTLMVPPGSITQGLTFWIQTFFSYKNESFSLLSFTAISFEFSHPYGWQYVEFHRPNHQYALEAIPNAPHHARPQPLLLQKCIAYSISKRDHRGSLPPKIRGWLLKDWKMNEKQCLTGKMRNFNMGRTIRYTSFCTANLTYRLERCNNFWWRPLWKMIKYFH